jgi:hypothetical protein
MNKYFATLICIVLISISACCHQTKNETSACMLEKINAFKSNGSAKAVLSIEVKGETYFWLNDDATYFDGSEYIYDNACNNVCYFCGECAFPECVKDFPYDKTKWEVVWKP